MSINTVSRTFLFAIDMTTSTRSTRKRSSLLTAFIWLILSSWRSKTKLWTRRSRRGTKSCTNSRRKSLLQLWSCRTLERSTRILLSRTSARRSRGRHWQKNLLKLRTGYLIWKGSAKKKQRNCANSCSQQVLLIEPPWKWTTRIELLSWRN